MKDVKIGEKRTFENYPGDWIVEELIKDKNIKHNLILRKNGQELHSCPHCGGVLGERKDYVFNHIEKLRQGDKIMHLGISDCGRTVLLEEVLPQGGVNGISN